MCQLRSLIDLQVWVFEQLVFVLWLPVWALELEKRPEQVVVLLQELLLP